MAEHVWCPYPNCGVEGTEDEVDDHRIAAHRSDPQQGSSLRSRPLD